MIAPIVPYAMRGTIWYQGESNTTMLAQALQYEKLFGRLIQDWRAQWGLGEFPFLYVQLASYSPAPKAGLGNWVWLRESQANVAKLPNTAMVTAVDIGDPIDPHPADKATVGHRLGLVARKLAYREALIVNGPVYTGMKVEGPSIRLSFAHEGSGLMIGTPPWSPTGARVQQAEKLTGFTIAGNDQQFINAEAVIDGDTVVVSHANIARPVAVRYNWSDVTTGNLYNRHGLPTAPFRSDSWEPTPPDAGPATRPQ
jgi:sialate O-acetylesterase